MNYELVLMFKPNLTEAQLDKAVESVKTLVTSLEGKVENEDKWGKKRMAYQIKSFQDAVYVLMNLNLGASQVKKLTSKLNINTDVMRYMVCSMEK